MIQAEAKLIAELLYPARADARVRTPLLYPRRRIGVVHSYYCAKRRERLKNLHAAKHSNFSCPVSFRQPGRSPRMWPELVIAVVDDDSSVRSALTRLVRSCGFRVESFPSGAEFLRSIDDHEPDCVVLDVNMPEMNGWEVQSHLSRAKADIPVIVISGAQDAEAHARAKRNGAQHYLRKPVDADLLLGAIRNAIASRTLPAQRETNKSSLN